MFAVEMRDKRPQFCGRNEIVVGDAKLSFPAFRDALHARLELAGRAQQLPSFAQQFFAAAGQPCAMAAAIEQQNIEILL